MNLDFMRRIAKPLGRSQSRNIMDDLRALDSLLQKERTTAERMSALAAQGVPVGIAGGLMGLVANPVTVNQATVTGGATELALIPTALYPVEQNVQSGKAYLQVAFGTSTTAATPGTYTFISRIGPAPTNASPAFGSVSGNFTPTASETAAPWYMLGFVVIRGSGTANTAAGGWFFSHSGTTGAGGPSLATSTGTFGGISASFDSTGSTCALWIGVTHATSTTNTWVPQGVLWSSFN